MAEKQINPIMKQVLELGPSIAFFIIYRRIKDNVYTVGETDYSGIIVATAAFIPILLVAMIIMWALSGKLSRLHLFTGFMVIVFGGLTIYFNDERFLKIKTSVVYGFLGTVLALGLWRGHSFLEWIMGELMPMQHEGWMIFTKRIAILYFALVAANEFVWRTQSTETWVTIETFVFPAVAMVVFMSQIILLREYLIEPDNETS